MRTTVFLLVCGFVLTADVGDSRADDSTAAAPDSDAIDLGFQGEYRGWQQANLSSRSVQPMGLQVIARGEGEFEAVKYAGGLPGERRFRSDRYQLQGRRSGEFVELVGENFDIVLENSTALIFDKEGRPAGEMARVERISPTMGLKPTAGAIVLFADGEPRGLKNPQVTEDGFLLAGTETAEAYQSFRLHAEFRLPFRPEATGQSRGNSGFYLQSRYEVQVLDSFGLEGEKNECGALYKQRAPDVNMCLPPMQWQTYDIDFQAPVIDADGEKQRNARISVWHNGTLIHNDVEIVDKTGAGQPEGPHPLPTKIQDHGNPVVFRNLWLVETTGQTRNGWSPVPPNAPSRPVAVLDRSDRLN